MSTGKNAYTCRDCGYTFVTIHVDDGVTPFGIMCRAATDCSGMAGSHFYKLSPAVAKIAPTFEWYKPTENNPLMDDPAVREHVECGGVMLRSVVE
jgi:hypothetical protein